MLWAQFNNHTICSLQQNKSREKARQDHEAVMRVLVRRYVMAEQRARDEVGVTEDDVMEIRQDISTLRYELIDILHNNGMKTPRVNQQDATGKILLLYFVSLLIT